ncbi:MAG: hypothetical protein DRJ42_00975 [Deltaproteobacteria bacterium]|nr:MAG: hypothetical protein DRJ42_00975 [Deltaproteobacteria bacterium]
MNETKGAGNDPRDMPRLSFREAAGRPVVGLFSLFGLLSLFSLSALAVLAGPVPASAQGRGLAQGSEAPLEALAARSERRAENASRLVSRRLDGARVEGRRTEGQCLDQTLNEINAVRRMLRHHARRLNNLEAREQTRRRTVFDVLSRRVGTLELQAVHCETGTVVADGQTRVITEISPDAPDIDPTVIPTPPRSDSGRDPGYPAGTVPPPGVP